MKKKFAFLLACLMMVSAVGCSTQETASSSSGGDTSSTGSSSSEAESSAEEENAEPDKLTYWVELNANASQLVQNFGDTEFAKEWQKATNTEIEFQHPPVGQSTEAFNILCASGDYPDIIEYAWVNYAGGPEAAIENNIIIPLNDVFDQYSPNMTAFLEEHEDMAKMLKTDAGNYYVYPGLRGTSADYVSASEGFVIRKDYLDQLGLEVPETIDEWYTVLTAFKNELNIEIPFCMRSDHTDRIFQGGFDSYDNFYVEDGVVKHGLIEPGRKEFLTEMHKWYEEGLLDNDWLVVDKKTQASYVTTGRCAATYAPGSSGIGTWLPAMQETDPNVELVSAPPVTSTKGQNAKFSQVNPVYSSSTTSAAISTSCQNIEAAARLLDYGYSEEGHMLNCFGIEGVSYEMVDGYPKYTELITDNPDGIAMSQIMTMYNRGGSSGPFVLDDRIFEQTYEIPELQEALKLWAMTDMGTYLLPPVTPTADEATELAQIVNNINTYKQEMEAKFISGAESLDNFDAFVEQLKNLGIERAIEIQQKAYDTYLQR